MNTKVETFPMDEIPLPNTYGAAELKGFIRRYTYRGLMVTVGLLILLMVFYFVFNKIQDAQSKEFEVPITKIDLENLPQEESEIIDIAPQVQTLNTGPAARAGNPVPVPDAQVSPDMKDFATTDVMDRASAEGGDGIDMGGFAANVSFEDKPVEVKNKEVEDIGDPNEFHAVEKEPNVDLGKLQGLVQYPDVARRAGIEGTVILRVYVDKNGQAKRVLVEHSDNQMLDKGAIDAITKYGYIPPAIQNGQNIGCWVSIPIKFKLR